MIYMLITHLDEKAWQSLGEAEQQRLMAEPMAHVERLRASGTIIRVRDGQRVITDGPYAETREQVGGYTLIDAKDREEAIAIAAGFMGPSSIATIEVRAVAAAKGVPTH